MSEPSKYCAKHIEHYTVCCKMCANERPFGPAVAGSNLLPPTVGRKDDAGKPEPSLLHQGCANAIAGIVAVLTYGFNKYGKRNGWKEVPEAKLRYKNALYRHLSAFERGELFDNGKDGSGLPNLDMVATNAAFLSELYHADGTYNTPRIPTKRVLA